MSASSHSTTPTALRSPAEAPTQRMAGWLSAGMLDWPGRVSATVFLSGCQLRCPYCHNPSLAAVDEGTEGDWDGLIKYVQRRRSWIDGVVVTGGEPTTDPDLVALLEFFASSNLPVKLDTNGMNPDTLSSLLRRQLVDFIALDVKTLPQHYEGLCAPADAADRLTRSIDVVRRSGLSHEFRTTCYPGIVDTDSIEAIARLLEGGAVYVLQQFRTDVTLLPEAAQHTPYPATTLLDTAARCSKWIPTVTRGM